MDTALFFLINRGTANPLFDIVMPALTYKGYLLAVPYLFFVLYKSMKNSGAAGKSSPAGALWTIVISIASVIIAESLEGVLKPEIERVRPCHVLEGVRLLTLCPEGYSMPSGHALSSFAFATPLVYLMRRYVSLAARLYPLALAALIAFSRVYLGVHYPSDILAGAGLGAGIGMLLSLVYEWSAKRKARHDNAGFSVDNR